MSNSNSDIQISIIVPVYNVVDYIERCLNSLISQTFKDFEIIIVDDGSTDGSEKICDKYEKNYDNITVIHQKNAGLSVARNVGIKKSIAPYLLFVDSDDTIDLNTCQKLYDAAMTMDTDIVRANSVVVQGEKCIPEKKKSVTEGKIYRGVDFLVENVKNHTMPMCAPFGLYRKKLIEENNLFFKEGILHEDELWTPQVYLHASKVAWIDYNFYYHYVRENSITHSKNKSRNAKDLINTCYLLYKKYSLLKRTYRIVLCDYLCMLYLNAVYVGKIYTAEKKFPLKTAYSIKNRLKALFYCISPYLYIRCNEWVKRRIIKEG